MTRVWALMLVLIASPVLAQNRPCGEEVDKFCQHITPGRGALLECLRPHQEQLSERCKRALVRIQRRREGVKVRRNRLSTVRSTTRTPATETPVATPATPVTTPATPAVSPSPQLP